MLCIGGGVAMLTGHVPAGVLALGGGLGGLGWLGRASRPVIRRYVPKPKAKGSRRDAGMRRKKAA